MMKYLIYSKIFFILITASNASSLHNAIKMRLQLQDTFGSEIVVVNEKNDNEVDLKINEVLHLNLQEGTYRRDVYQSKIPLNQIALDYFKSQKILWTETLDSKGYFKSTLIKDSEDQRYTTADYEVFFTNLRSEIKKPCLVFVPDKVLKKDENNEPKLDYSIIKIGLLLENKVEVEALSVKHILIGSIANELGFEQGDIIKSACSDNIGASLKNVINYGFDDKCNSITYNVERAGKAITIKILKPSRMEAVLHSKPK